MPFNSTPISVKDSAAIDRSLIAYNDGTSSAFAHPLLDNAGAIINPATAGNQVTINSKLDTVIANTGAGCKTYSFPITMTGTTHNVDTVVGSKISITNAVRAGGLGGYVQTAIVMVQENILASYDIMLFNADPTATTFTDGGAYSLNTADFGKLVNVVRCDVMSSLGTAKALLAPSANAGFHIPTGTTLFAAIVARGPATFTIANSVVLNLVVVQD